MKYLLNTGEAQCELTQKQADEVICAICGAGNSDADTAVAMNAVRELDTTGRVELKHYNGSVVTLVRGVE